MLLKFRNAPQMPGTGTMPTPLVAVYAEGGTYHTPRFDHPLKGKALADFIKSVLTAFPDLRFEVISRGDTGGGLVAVQLVLHSTHTGSFMDGTPPTGRKVTYTGASFVQVEGDKIRSEQVYVDRQTVAEQLGLKASEPEVPSTGSLRPPNGNRIKQASGQRHAEVGEFSSALNTTFQ